MALELQSELPMITVSDAVRFVREDFGPETAREVESTLLGKGVVSYSEAMLVLDQVLTLDHASTGPCGRRTGTLTKASHVRVVPPGAEP